jgi:type IV secretion system protein VirB8
MLQRKEPISSKGGVSPKVEKVVQKSIDFETTREQVIRTSERRAWMVASASLVIVLLLVAGLYVLLPLKERVPYLVTANPYTGTSYITRLPDHEDTTFVTANEAMNKANLANYVVARESYDWNLWDKRDSIVVYAMSGADTRREWEAIYKDASKSPDVIFGQGKVGRVYIKSIVLTAPDPKTGQYSGAQVTFDRITYEKATGSRLRGESFVATIAFSYKNNLRMSEELRLQNPLGFQVTNYRLDPDLSSSSSGVILQEATGSVPSANVK